VHEVRPQGYDADIPAVGRIEGHSEGGGVVKNAYCNVCGARVMLTDDGECVNGHPRSALRDVQEGPIAPAQASARPASPSNQAAAGSDFSPPSDRAAKVVGVLVVVVPAAIVLAAAVWITYQVSVGAGWSKKASAWSTALEILGTAAVVWFVVWNRRRKSGRY
jgi:hypothetical protein